MRWMLHWQKGQAQVSLTISPKHTLSVSLSLLCLFLTNTGHIRCSSHTCKLTDNKTQSPPMTKAALDFISACSFFNLSIFGYIYSLKVCRGFWKPGLSSEGTLNSGTHLIGGQACDLWSVDHQPPLSPTCFFTADLQSVDQVIEVIILMKSRSLRRKILRTWPDCNSIEAETRCVSVSVYVRTYVCMYLFYI